MIFNETPLAGSYEITLQPFSDDRGWFARTYCKREFESIGHVEEWVQMNHSFTKQKGSIRGMHFQHSPHEEIKMIRCISGAIYDVIVDIRKDSPTYLQWFGIELSAENGKMLYIPKGFAHGFQTLEDNCALIYHHSAFYMPEVEGGLRYDDPKLNIKWPLAVKDISARDRQHPLIN
ncbi:dTDP-4-dehydrorhamnose 3,5-epimerase [Chitinophaga sp.]|uniref:dTDP-4-dehydrorhamnose 3,5-epimerase n=1 Tax=Chitinophaga sp. TaxID=1869181 RepID=UPI0031E3B726